MGNQIIRNLVAGSFVGILHGDRAGIPFETRTPEEILKMTGGKGFTRLVRIPRNHRFKEVRALPPYGTTDDWGLTNATIRGIIAHGPRLHELSPLRMRLAREFMDEYRRCGIGYGRGTKDSLAEMDAWLRGDEVKGRSPLEPAPARPPGKHGVPGTGNGVAMRIAPVGLAVALSDQLYNLEDPVFALGRMTHGDYRASFAAYALARVLMSLVRAKLEETEINYVWLRAMVRTVMHQVYTFEDSYGITSEVSKALEHVTDPRILESNKTLRDTVGTSVVCWESVPYAIGVFLRNWDNPEAALRESVNGGGDTDSIASMVGGLTGFIHGYDALPRSWKKGSVVEHACVLADRFCATFGH